jgi:hypothetical protein
LSANDADAAFATSLFLHSTVINKNVPGRVTIDAGLKSFATDGPLLGMSAGAFASPARDRGHAIQQDGGIYEDESSGKGGVWML